MRFRPPQPVRLELNLAPMVDVIMCLIIFFLLASRLVDAQHPPSQLAYAASARQVDRSELGQRVVVTIRTRRDASGEADFVVPGWDGHRISDRVLDEMQLLDFIRQRVAQAGDRGELRCVIRAEKDVPYARVEQVLRACGQVGISHVVFATHAGHDPEGAP